MATYYWVGGSGSWTFTATANWSTTNGGTGGAGPPTTADDVNFTSLSNATSYTVTIATTAPVCRSITVAAPLTGTVTFGGTASLTVFGNFTLPASGCTWSHTGVINFSATTTGWTITTNGTSVSSIVNFNGSGGGWTLGSALTTTSTATLAIGALALSSFTLTSTTFTASGTSTRSINFGTGNITVTGTGTVWASATVTGFTTSGTQVVNVTNSTATATTIASGALSEANSISFNITSGTYTLAFLAGASSTARNVNFTGFSGTWGATVAATIYGNLTLSSGMTLTSSALAMTFGASSGTKTITSNGKTFPFPIAFNGASGTWQLQDALTQSSTAAPGMTLTNGTLDLNGKTASVTTGFTIGAGTKNLTFNGGTLTVSTSGATAFNNANPTGFTTTAGTGTGTISMISTLAKTFVGGGSTYNCNLNQGASGTLTITGSNTFLGITNTVQPTTITFTVSTTQTLTNWGVSGTAGNLITINSSTPGTQATLSKSSGTVSADYLNIQDSNATGGASWYAGTHSGNIFNNTGWIFTAPPSGGFIHSFGYIL